MKIGTENDNLLGNNVDTSKMAPSSTYCFPCVNGENGKIDHCHINFCMVNQLTSQLDSRMAVVVDLECAAAYQLNLFFC